MLRSGVFTVLFWSCVALAGCATQPPIVADPPEHPRSPSEPIPWEEQYGRAMMKPEAGPEAPPDPHHEQRFNGTLQDPEGSEGKAGKEDRGALGVVTDVLAFPFRAIGWLFQSIF